MFHLHPGSFGIGFEDPAADRDRMHRVALHEARIATDHRAADHDDLALANSLRAARPRLATPRGGSADLAACCA
ncbi:MAG: hypothetical protein HY264_05790 [Chloroflexi bacterium]|nr:hypothetical protein [Chloroflexota bacterium]